MKPTLKTIMQSEIDRDAPLAAYEYALGAIATLSPLWAPAVVSALFGGAS